MKNYKFLLFFALGFALMLSSCKDEEYGSYSRLFSPVGISATATGNTLDVTWQSIPGAERYKVEIAANKTMTRDLDSYTTTDARTTHTFKNLAYEQTYYFRLTALSGDAEVGDSKANISSGFKTKDAPKLLNPIKDEDKDEDAGTVTVTWVTTFNNVTYSPVKLDLSLLDGTQKQLITLTPAALTAKSYTFTGLEQDNYVITIIVADSDAPSGETWMNKQDARFFEPLLPVDLSTVTSSQATLKWKSGFEVTKLVLTPADGEDITVPIVSAASLSQVVTGLTPATRYVAQIFVGDRAANKVAFSTWYAIPAGAVVVGPTNYLADSIYKYAGKTIVLTAGNYQWANSTGNYTFANRAKCTLIADAPSPKPVIACPQNTYFTGDTVALSFVGVEFKPFTGTAGQHLFRINAANVHVRKLELLDCNVTGTYRNVLRMETAAKQTIDSMIMNNCLATNLFDGSNSYNIYHTNAADGALCPKYTSITNSTFNGYVGLYRENSVAADATEGRKVIIENCTLYKHGLASGSNAVTDVHLGTASKVAVGMKNLLFGGMNAGTGTYTSVNSVANSTVAGADCYSTTNYTGTTFSGLTAFQGSDSQVFSSATTGDFTLINPSLIQIRVGDPRWVPEL